MRAAIAVGVLLGIGAGDAVADGERTPMFGIAVVGADTSRTSDHDVSLAGVGLDLAWWHGPVGLAVEGSELWSIVGDGSRVGVAGASLRLRVFQRVVPSLLDPRDVELGVELQGIAEHRWWSGTVTTADPTAYGVGIAIRLRGGGDAPGSTLLAESRVFVRVMASTWSELDAVARTTTPMGGMMQRPVTVVLGLGGSWGSGTGTYADRFRMHPFDMSVP